MKYIFSIILVFSFNLSFSQMTVSEMIRVYNMDMDQFETYAISKGYDLSEFQQDKDFDGVKYGIGLGKETRHLSLFDEYYLNGKTVEFQTRIPNELLNIKTQLKNFGFKLYKSYLFNKKQQVKLFRNKIFELAITTFPIDDEHIYNVYMITLNKK